jgi:hypothetical protein
MANFDNEKFKKKLKKKIKKNLGKNTQFNVKTKGPLYFFGFIGAAIYYVSTATDFWVGVLGILKAIVWPAFLVYEALAKLA